MGSSQIWLAAYDEALITICSTFEVLEPADEVLDKSGLELSHICGIVQVSSTVVS